MKCKRNEELIIPLLVKYLMQNTTKTHYNEDKRVYLYLTGYFRTLMSEKLGGNIAVTLLCPGPVFSNLLPVCFTAKQGETFNQHMGHDDKRMTTERCGYLCAVAIANKLSEAWIGLFPAIPLSYILIYLPNVSRMIAQSLGTKGLMNIRDSRQTIKKND